MAQVTLPASYLKRKLAQPLPIRACGTLRTIREAGDYMAALPEGLQLRRYWQRAAELMFDQADVGAVTLQLELALFMDGQLTLGSAQHGTRQPADP